LRKDIARYQDYLILTIHEKYWDNSMKNNKWIRTLLVWVFVYIPAFVTIVAGLSIFGLAFSITIGIVLFTSEDVKNWLVSKKGFKYRLSKLPGISGDLTRNSSILLVGYVLGLSFISWLLLGGSHTTSLGVDIFLSLIGMLLFYGLFIQGWFIKVPEHTAMDGEGDISDLLGLFPKSSFSTISKYLLNNFHIGVLLGTALVSPILCVGSGALLLNSDKEEPTPTFTPDFTEEALLTSKLDATQTPFVIVVTATDLPPTPTGTFTITPTRTKTATPTITLTPSPTPEREKAQVVKVIDGDTIKVYIDGAVYTVRYIGIDTPEIQNSEWMGQEALDANIKLVSGEEVYLEKDVSNTDQYNRLLRYVFLIDGTFVNAELVKLGFAVSIAYPPDTKYQSILDEMEKEAVNKVIGIWVSTPTPKPTNTPLDPTENVQITSVNKVSEYVDIKNFGFTTVSLNGWMLRSEKGFQDCYLGGNLEPGITLRIWALAADDEEEGYNCGKGSNIWNNSEPDPAVLYNSDFQEVDRY